MHPVPARDTADARGLTVGHASDPAERAANSVADRIMRGGPAALSFDFNAVRVFHDDAAARSMGALAFAVGRDVVLGDRANGRVLAHELGHVVAEAGRPGPPVVRRQIVPEDVSSEMVGRSMLTTAAVTSPRGTEPVGSTVTVVAWDNVLPTVRVRFPARPPAAAVEIDVPKAQLRPARTAAPGIAPYSAGLPGQLTAINRAEAAIAAERARPGGPRPGEIPRMEGLQANRLRTLNRMLIQETMFNRFDPDIRRWTDHYNTQFGFTGAARLEANLVKSMLYHESQMGTLGPHLMAVPPSAASRKTRFNLGQVVDTSGPALLIMMEEIDPAILATHHITHLRDDLRIAQRRHKDLTDLTSRTPAEAAELAALTAQSEPNKSWETFFWSYRATGAPSGFVDAVLAFFTPAPGGVSRRMDYEFWIRTAIRWLFEKRRTVSSWAEAVRAYNGSGESARRYRDAVTGRSAAAIAAERAGRPYVPTR